MKYRNLISEVRDAFYDSAYKNLGTKKPEGFEALAVNVTAFEDRMDKLLYQGISNSLISRVNCFLFKHLLLFKHKGNLKSTARCLRCGKNALSIKPGRSTYINS